MYEAGRRLGVGLGVLAKLAESPNAHSHCHYITTSDTMYNELNSAWATAFIRRHKAVASETKRRHVKAVSVRCVASSVSVMLHR